MTFKFVIQLFDYSIDLEKQPIGWPYINQFITALYHQLHTRITSQASATNRHTLPTDSVPFKLTIAGYEISYLTIKSDQKTIEIPAEFQHIICFRMLSIAIDHTCFNESDCNEILKNVFPDNFDTTRIKRDVLHQAVEDNDIQKVKELLKMQYNPDALDIGRRKITPLMIACQRNRKEIAELLLIHGANFFPKVLSTILSPSHKERVMREFLEKIPTKDYLFWLKQLRIIALRLKDPEQDLNLVIDLMKEKLRIMIIQDLPLFYKGIPVKIGFEIQFGFDFWKMNSNLSAQEKKSEFSVEAPKQSTKNFSHLENFSHLNFFKKGKEKKPILPRETADQIFQVGVRSRLHGEHLFSILADVQEKGDALLEQKDFQNAVFYFQAMLDIGIKYYGNFYEQSVAEAYKFLEQVYNHLHYFSAADYAYKQAEKAISHKLPREDVEKSCSSNPAETYIEMAVDYGFFGKTKLQKEIFEKLDSEERKWVTTRLEMRGAYIAPEEEEREHRESRVI